MKYLILIALVGCGTNRKLALTYSKDDTNTTGALESFVPKINEKLGCEAISLNHNPDNRPQFSVKYDPELIKAKRLEWEDPSLIGWCDHQGQRIVYTRGDNTDKYLEKRDGDAYIFVTLTLLHEIGHALWLTHEPLTVMNSVLMLYTEEEAVQSLVDLLNSHHMNPCLPYGAYPIVVL